MNKKKFDDLIKDLEKVNSDNNYIKSILIKDNNNLYEKYFTDKNESINIRSQSKTILALICGIVLDKVSKDINEFITEDEYIYPIVKNKIKIDSNEQIQKLKKIKIKHLLTQTSGLYNFDISVRKLDKTYKNDLLSYLLSQDFIYEPEAMFYYTNANYEILAIVLQELLEEDLYKFSCDYFFNKLDIDNPFWEKNNSYITGSSNLYLKADELLKIGELFLNKGSYKINEVVPKLWMKKILNTSVNTGMSNGNKYLDDSTYSYGIWRKDDLIYYASGSKGQLLVVIPKSNMIIVLLSDNKLCDSQKLVRKFWIGLSMTNFSKEKRIA